MRSWLRNFLGMPSAAIHPPTRRRLQYKRKPLPALYAIGDIHGGYTELVDAERRIAADAERTNAPSICVYLGDYVDKGPDSAMVLDHLSSDETFALRRILLCGNHDDVFLRCLLNPQNLRNWLDFGGDKTLQSYGIDAEYLLKRRGGEADLAALMLETIPARHRQFLERLSVMFVADSFVFVHAGVRPGIALNEQTDQDLMWIREPFLTKGPQLPVNVIHGHTPSAEPVFGEGRVGIDTAAYATGHLSVLRIYQGNYSFV